MLERTIYREESELWRGLEEAEESLSQMIDLDDCWKEWFNSELKFRARFYNHGQRMYRVPLSTSPVMWERLYTHWSAGPKGDLRHRLLRFTSCITAQPAVGSNGSHGAD